MRLVWTIKRGINDKNKEISHIHILLRVYIQFFLIFY